ncbi:TetR family transcriptional regulator C-terminal domain-containing protein [Actinomycetospora termitidis]|uniref:TetR family transcriptional regulator C-terminal domain-containing protein n=1 Tax=Actinomycetospora termitidis TaxID=3053470 RepID=A0ABT7MEA2_9PSEU|nr:TetR family transcriptional regulator C-terminal domain-containing protein [Actinomycetospora sp. Odt1-22]MDL5158519.1 TetR family transcriptional regulator C-terminal domain-containing protein [Actinomycetospora sp. Odt1-22]
MSDDEVRHRVRGAIDAAGSRRRVAAAVGLDETKLSKSLAGRRRFTADELDRIAAATGTELAWLLHADGTPPVTAASDLIPARSEPDDARKRILDAAWTLIATRGYHRVRIADVAEAAGTSSASVHYHYADKDALLDEALRHNVELAHDRQSAALTAIDDPAVRLEKLLDLQLPDGPVLEPEWSIWMQVWVEALTESRHRDLYARGQDRWFRTVLMTLEAGAEAGVFRGGDQTLRARQLTALVDGLGVGVMTGVSTAADMRAALHEFVAHTIRKDDR